MNRRDVIHNLLLIWISIGFISAQNVCKQSQCLNGGSCIESQKSFKCHCPSNYFGRTCSIPSENEIYQSKSNANEHGCHFPFMRHEVNTSSFCAYLFLNTMTWMDAQAICRISYSSLTHEIGYDSSLHATLKKFNVDLLWVGIHRKANFFIVESSATLFRAKQPSSSNSWNNQWAMNEPTEYDCVALNATSGFLITQNCSSLLPFFCDDREVTRVNDTSNICPSENDVSEKWVLSYPLSTDGKKCIANHKPRSQADAKEICENSGGRLATTKEYDILDIENYLPHASYGDGVYWTNRESCVFKVITSIYSNGTNNHPQNCYSKSPSSKSLPFTCIKEYEKEIIKVWISPSTVQAFPSNFSSKELDLYTCNVSIDGYRKDGQEKFLSYQWYKDDIPIPIKAFVFRMSHFYETLKINPYETNIVARQGSYKCEVKILGSSKSFFSSKIDFFYSDIATYIIDIRNIPPYQYRDFSAYDFPKTINTFKDTVMTKMIQNVKFKYPSAIWDFQSISVVDGNTRMKILFYIFRTHQDKFNDDITFNYIKKIFEENSISSVGNMSFIVNSADVCFSMRTENDTCGNKINWFTTSQTTSILSKPMCLDKNNRLVQRKCQASNIKHAKWSSFNCSSCHTFQQKIDDLDFLCFDGYMKIRNTNLCYKIFYEKKTWQDAFKECSESSSYMINELYDGIDTSFDFWLSYKFLKGKIQPIGMKPKNKKWKDITTDNYDADFHCLSANFLDHYMLKLENCNKKHSFICIKNPIELESTVKFSNTWTKFFSQSNCYYFSNESAYTWLDAQMKCEQMIPKANFLKGIQYLESYRHLKLLMFKLFNDYIESDGHTISWWMNLTYNKGHFINVPENFFEEYVDWNPHTNFSLSNAHGTLTLSNKEIQWSLAEDSSRYGYICEMQNCDDNRPTQAYIENRFKNKKYLSLANFTSYHKSFVLKCIPSGWFLTNSINWYKDGILLPNTSDVFSFKYSPPPKLEDSLKLQGYYSCSVMETTSRQIIFSSTVLYKIPGIDTFVLSMKSQSKHYLNDCLNFMLSEIAVTAHRNISFVDCFKRVFETSLNFHLKNLTCNSTHADINLHIYTENYNKTEKDTLQWIQNIDYNHFAKECNVDFESIIAKSTVYCYEEKMMLKNKNLTWPTTPIGEIAIPEELCLTAEGTVIERQCVGDFNIGAVWSIIPLTECMNNIQSNVTVKLHQLLQQDIAASFMTPSSLTSLTSSPKELIPADIQIISEILAQFASQSSFTVQSLNLAIEVINSLMDVPPQVIIEATNSSNQILESFDHIVSNVVMDDRIQIAKTNIAISIHSLNSTSFNPPNCALLTDWSKNITTFFNVSIKDLKDNISDAQAGIVLPTSLIKEKLNKSDHVTYMINENFNYVKNISVVAAVIGASFGHISVYDINPPVDIFFKLNRNFEDKLKSLLKCVYWDQTLNDNFGGWSYKGCHLNRLKDDYVSCLCNHLTSFTVILELDPSPMELAHKTALSIITYVGCLLSSFGLGMIILTFICFKEWRKSIRNKAVFNLSACLICFLILFMSGINQTNTGYSCLVIAIFLHYFLLASFAWMLVSAFMMYLTLVRVLGAYIPCLIQKAMIFAYGMPAAIVIVIVSYKYELYYQKHYCWISHDVFYYAIAAPVLLMLFANFIIFGIILYANTCGKSKTYLRSNQNYKKLAIARTKALFFSSVLLGLSWIFGFLAIGKTKIIFQYLFAITTTLQGFVIFIFFVVRQRTAHNLWYKCLFPSSASDKALISNISSSVPNKFPNRKNNDPYFNSSSICERVIYKVHSSDSSYNS